MGFRALWNLTAQTLYRPFVFSVISAYSKAWSANRLMAFAMAVAVVSLAAGCASKGFGRLYLDAEVTQMFRTNSVPEYYKYYTTGRSNLPYAIIGIDPRYRVEGGLWEPVAPNTDSFASKVRFVWRPDIWEKLDPAEGAWIKSPDGDKIGIWYSMYPYTTVKMEDGNRVAILSPFNPAQE